MNLQNLNSRTATAGDINKDAGRVAKYYGVYMGFVKNSADIQTNGRLVVWVPEMGSAPDDEAGWVIANYCSPFAGVTNIETTNTSNYADFDETQTSYGMWMVPPDINNQVLVMFINGDPARCIWIGSLFGQFMNNMVPGTASGTNNYQYQGKNVPTAEYNKFDTSVTDPDKATKPYHATKFKGIGNQGLITDTTRAVTNSTARRESPSEVFGIVTPGPVIDKNKPLSYYRRKGGHAFVMDDHESNEYIQFTTKSGAQVNINETNGFVYLINRDGTSWVQMDKDGNVDIFGAKDISLRAQRDINFRADRNINIEAGQNIFMKAAKDTKETTTKFTYNVNNTPDTKDIPVWSIVGEGKGDGGNIVMQSLNNWHSTTKGSAYLTVLQDNFNLSVGNSLSVTTVNGNQEFNSSKGIKLTTSGSFDFAATGDIRVGSNGLISVVGASGVTVCTENSISLNSSNNTIITSGGEVSLDGTAFNIGTGVFVDGELDCTAILTDSIESTDISTVNIKSNTVCFDNEALGGGLDGNVNPPVIPIMLNPNVADAPLSAGNAQAAEIKPLNEKTNILATWQSILTYPSWVPNMAYNPGSIVIYNDVKYIANKQVFASLEFDSVAWDIFVPEDKFKRDSEAIQTTVSRLPTYEPCPEHETFKTSSISGYKPILTSGDNTYEGSGGAGNSASSAPSQSKNPGADNTMIQSDPVSDSNVSKDLNMNALRCQLIIHEGLKKSSYNDSLGLLTGGIGHLLRSNEIPSYPLGTPISDEQIERWYIQDSVSAIKIAQVLLGSDVWGDLSDIRKRAMTDLAYNLGKSKLSKFVNFLTAMKSKNFNLAGQELRNSAWFGQVGIRGPKVVSMIVQNIDPNGCDKKFPE